MLAKAMDFVFYILYSMKSCLWRNFLDLNIEQPRVGAWLDWSKIENRHVLEPSQDLLDLLSASNRKGGNRGTQVNFCCWKCFWVQMDCDESTWPYPRCHSSNTGGTFVNFVSQIQVILTGTFSAFSVNGFPLKVFQFSDLGQYVQCTLTQSVAP